MFLKKIEAYGFSENAVDLFASFLKTVLGPLVFLLYINDFREKVQGNFDIFQFAYDTSFHFSLTGKMCF